MNTKSRQAANTEGGDWLILSDLAMGGFIIFFIITVVFLTRYVQSETKLEVIEEQDLEAKLDSLQRELDEFKDAQSGIYAALKGFDSIPMIDVKKDGTIRFKVEEGKELFPSGRAIATRDFEEVLGRFLPAYFDSIEQYYDTDQIVEIRIEGHTDTICPSWNAQEKDCFRYNVDLSHQRAGNILDFMLMNQRYHALKDKLKFRSLINVVGCSYSKGIDQNGQYVSKTQAPADPVQSRRVDLKTIIKPREKQIQ
ncbi:MAG: hypothetical protein MK212_08900 [Saprospiraceae bacterium]|nr:hypothetical protein [Saprospiraceae bacterium]